MRKLFIPLLLFSALEANEKNGFFIEAGFETGLLEGTQTQEQRRTTTQKRPQKPPRTITIIYH